MAKTVLAIICIALICCNQAQSAESADNIKNDIKTCKSEAAKLPLIQRMSFINRCVAQGINTIKQEITK